MFLALQRVTHKRRVADDIVGIGAHLVPVGAQGVALMDVGVALQRQEVDVAMDDALGLGQHLASLIQSAVVATVTAKSLISMP